MDLAKFKKVSHATWEAMAPGWDERHQYFEKIARPVTERMLTKLDPSTGAQILELAAGTGDVGFSVASLVGPGGKVIVSDFAQAMVDAARRRAESQGLENVEFRVLDAEALELEDNCVDGVICRWGYMLMENPGAALRETRRVLRKNGRISCAVFSGPTHNPWAAIPAKVLVEHGHMPAPTVGTPGILALGDRERLLELFTATEFKEPAIDAVDFTVHASDFDDYWDLLSRAAGAIAMVLGRLDDTAQQQVREAIADAIRPFSSGGRIEMPAQSLVVSAS